MTLLGPPHSSATPQDPGDAPAPRGFWPMRDLPTAIWLMLTVVAALAHGSLPAPRWLVIHLLLLGAITHAILVWSQYFSFALLRSRSTLRERGRQNLRLILANAGAALVFIGVPTRIWALSLAGTTLIIAAVAWHGLAIARRLRGSLPGQFGKTTRYYIAASALLLVGAALGALLARYAPAYLVLAHLLVNMLGWVGLTVAGTVVTLWPTILRTRADVHAASGAARALPALAGGVVVAAGGAALASMPLLALGLAAYLAGLVIIGVSLVRAARRSRDRSFAARSVGCALTWWIAIVSYLLVGTLVAWVCGWGFVGVSELVRSTAPYLAAGFAAQVLIGALSYLVPVVLGGGPAPVKAGNRAFDRFGALRVTVANVALLALVAVACVGALDIAVPRFVWILFALSYLVAMASFIPIMLVAMRAQRLAKRIHYP